MDEALYARVRKLVAEQLGIDESAIHPESRFKEDLNADSLDVVETVMKLEEEFGVSVGDEDAEKLQSVGDLVKFLEENKGGDGAK